MCFQAHAESDLRYNGPSSSHATFYLRYRESPLLPPSLSLTVRFSRRRQNEFFKTGQSCPSCVKTRRWLPASPAVKFTVFIAASSALLTWPLRARPPFAQAAPPALASLLSSDCAKHAPISGTSHLLPPRLELSPQGTASCVSPLAFAPALLNLLTPSSVSPSPS